MTRALHLGLLLMALLGLFGQSTARAMVPTPLTIGSLQVSMSDMNCMEGAKAHVPGKAPCKTMTMQCMAAMGGVPMALIEPVEPSAAPIASTQIKSALPLAARLWGRSYGPEPDPPSFLI